MWEVYLCVCDLCIVYVTCVIVCCIVLVTRSVGIFRSRTKGHGVCLFLFVIVLVTLQLDKIPFAVWNKSEFENHAWAGLVKHNVVKIYGEWRYSSSLHLGIKSASCPSQFSSSALHTGGEEGSLVGLGITGKKMSLSLTRNERRFLGCPARIPLSVPLMR
jgi:hypothetical protein